MNNTLIGTLVTKLCTHAFTFLLMVALGLCFVGCDNSNEYDKGYESGWNGEDEPDSIWYSKLAKEGYQDGLDDSETYDEGYYDGMNKLKPIYFNDPLYMDGFKDGKKQR